MTEKKLQKIAREEISKWRFQYRDYARIIIACFVFRLSRGVPIESMFEDKNPELDYQI